jgi:hypothetical protein
MPAKAAHVWGTREASFVVDDDPRPAAAGRSHLIFFDGMFWGKCTDDSRALCMYVDAHAHTSSACVHVRSPVRTCSNVYFSTCVYSSARVHMCASLRVCARAHRCAAKAGGTRNEPPKSFRRRHLYVSVLWPENDCVAQDQ